MICERCGINEASDSHLCPMRQELDDDQETECTCCEECEQQCREDT